MRSAYRGWVVVAAITWCCVFAAVHWFWALGGSVGLASSAGSDLATRRPPLFVAAGLWGVGAVLLAGAAFVGVAAAGNVPLRWRRIMAWTIGLAGLVLLARGVLVQVALATDMGGVRGEVGPHQTRWSLVLWNPWFVLGGVLLAAAGHTIARRWSPSTATCR
ncbi:DUF3995 domain-containing protein [Nocardia vermiculata]|uniref:DUF3995 domain-containing protein n=1 Tax=Nocardia vermiculata TaxID=257274 RepID=A0A846XW44_9NOCA|nr:DUF3995 domain-containing protein [Nocardia vermiculata]NKY50857.1 DUF3995 domain-containing protein [Nocardia vermiculata]